MIMRGLSVGFFGLLCAATFAQDGASASVVEARKGPLRYDAAVEAIVVPSDDPRYAAYNPAVHEPRVVIRNLGTEALVAISIRYGTTGFQERMFAWNGRLGTGASAEVTLPHLIDMLPGVNTFSVTLGDPNGRKDRNRSNNTLTTTFTPADLLGTRFDLRLRTTKGTGGWLHLESTRGRVLVHRAWSASASDTILFEEVDAPVGSYVLQLSDSVAGGHSSVRLFDGSGRLLKGFVGRAKEGARYQFRVEQDAVAKPQAEPDVVLHMLPGRGQAVLDQFANSAGRMVFTIADPTGEVVDGATYEHSTDQVVFIDLAKVPANRYTVIVERDGAEVFRSEMNIADPGRR